MTEEWRMPVFKRHCLIKVILTFAFSVLHEVCQPATLSYL